jgi:hypothetical protein
MGNKSLLATTQIFTGFSNQFITTINCILLNNQQLLVELFQMYASYTNSRPLSSQFDIQYDASDEMKPTSVKVFETFIKFLCHMLHICDLNVLIQIVQSMKSSMKLIFSFRYAIANGYGRFFNI